VGSHGDTAGCPSVTGTHHDSRLSVSRHEHSSPNTDRRKPYSCSTYCKSYLCGSNPLCRPYFYDSLFLSNVSAARTDFNQTSEASHQDANTLLYIDPDPLCYFHSNVNSNDNTRVYSYRDRHAITDLYKYNDKHLDIHCNNSKSNTYSYTIAHLYKYSNSYSNCHCDRYANVICYSNAECNSDIHPNSDTYSHGDRYFHRHNDLFPDCLTIPHGYTDCNPYSLFNVNPNIDVYIYRDPNSHSDNHPYLHTHLHKHSYCYSHGDSNSHPDTHTN
jgi:hypothetical protein